MDRVYGFLLAIIGGATFLMGTAVGLTVMTDGNEFGKSTDQTYGALIIVTSIIICAAFVTGGYLMERSLLN